MPWVDYIAHAFGGVFLANAVPHFVHGISGRPFQSPFAKPPGVGLSSSTVNMIWALVNLVFAWVLLARIGSFDLRDPAEALSFGLGAALIGLFLAHHFGRHNGGNI
jgi:hypothetical protein